ncbi:MAG: hypothetical protein A3K22_04645 [Deltaproteobacteria bacterium RBG_16_42_7]|nr:MAG: hypothetical protein A3K22_04645 [Deltaproteobacteria bacterium RBG_16_42_7]
MDINLGKGMDGTEAADIISCDHGIPLLFLSCHTQKDIVETRGTCDAERKDGDTKEQEGATGYPGYPLVGGVSR